MELFNALQRVGVVTQAYPHEKHQPTQRVKSEVVVNNGKREQPKVADQYTHHEKGDDNDTTPHDLFFHLFVAKAKVPRQHFQSPQLP